MNLIRLSPSFFAVLLFMFLSVGSGSAAAFNLCSEFFVVVPAISRETVYSFYPTRKGKKNNTRWLVRDVMGSTVYSIPFKTIDLIDSLLTNGLIDAVEFSKLVSKPQDYIADIVQGQKIILTFKESRVVKKITRLQNSPLGSKQVSLRVIQSNFRILVAEKDLDFSRIDKFEIEEKDIEELALEFISEIEKLKEDPTDFTALDVLILSKLYKGLMKSEKMASVIRGLNRETENEKTLFQALDAFGAEMPPQIKASVMQSLTPLHVEPSPKLRSDEEAVFEVLQNQSSTKKKKKRFDPMTDLSVQMPVAKILRKLQSEGWKKVRSRGSHHILEYEYNGQRMAFVEHAGDKTLKTGTFQTIIKRVAQIMSM